MTVKIDEKDKVLGKRKYETSFLQENKLAKESSPKPKRKKISIGCGQDPVSVCPPDSLCSPGTKLSAPATVCYEGEGILVVQLEWRGKIFFGTLLSQDKCDRKFKISENFPILNKASNDVVKRESDSTENDIRTRENSLSDKSSQPEKSDIRPSTKSENKKELDKENSTDCFDFDNEDFLDKDTTYKGNKKSSKKQFTKGFKCDLCDKKYTWYTGLSNHKRFVHNNKTKET